MNKSIGEFIRTRRRELGLTQTDLASRMVSNGFHYGTTAISAWEIGRTTPPMHEPDFIVALASSLEIEPTELLEGSGLLGDERVMTMDELSPLERQLVLNLRRGLISEALEQVAALSKKK